MAAASRDALLEGGKAFLASFVATLLIASASYAQQQTTTKDQLVGTWKVQTLKATSGDKVTYPLGEQPTGYVTDPRADVAFVC